MNLLESNLFLVGMITVLAVVSPGPDFAVILRNGLRYGRKMGLATALGIASGVVVHTTYSLLGLSFIVSEYSWILEVIRFAGASYLIWLGVSAFLPQKNKITATECCETAIPISFWDAFRNGFFCNALNPKTMLFFIALFTQVISPTTSLIAKIGIGIFISLTHLLWFSLIAFVLTDSRTLKLFAKCQKSLEKIVGGCLLILGTKLALET